MQNNPAIPLGADEESSDRQFATTLARGLDILRCFSPERSTLGNKELAELTGLPKATVSRFTYTLVRLGYLRLEASSTRYQLGSAVLSLSYPLLASMDVRQVARPAMHAFADAMQCSVSLGVRDRLNIVYVETARARTVYSTRMAEVGLAHPLVASAIGRAYLCACTLEERERLLNETRVKQPQLWEKYIPQVERSVAEFRQLRFCYSYGDLRPDIYAAAVPLRRGANAEIVVMNCVLQSYQVGSGDLERAIGPRLVALAGSLEMGKAYSGDSSHVTADHTKN